MDVVQILVMMIHHHHLRKDTDGWWETFESLVVQLMQELASKDAEIDYGTGQLLLRVADLYDSEIEEDEYYVEK